MREEQCRWLGQWIEVHPSPAPGFGYHLCEGCGQAIGRDHYLVINRPGGTGSSVSFAHHSCWDARITSRELTE